MIKGRTLVFHDVCVDDAGFILSLRTDQEKGRHLSATSGDIESQVLWLKNYTHSSDQAYFLISYKEQKVGTVRLYDSQGYSFSWGSWIIQAGVPNHVAIESALMVYRYGLDYLGFTEAHFDVRKGNERVWQFHERFGAARILETSTDYYYSINAQMIRQALTRYKKFLPVDVIVTE